MKHCSACNELKSLDEFNKHPDTKDKKSTFCRVCSNQKCKDWYAKNQTRKKNYGLKYKYGISLEKFLDMVSNQRGCCAICSVEFTTDKSTHVDHNHSTGEIRMLLCNSCNHLLGNAKDSIQILENAIEYLKYHSPKE